MLKLSGRVCVYAFYFPFPYDSASEVHLSCTLPISLQPHHIWPLCSRLHFTQQTKKKGSQIDKRLRHKSVIFSLR